MTMVTQNERKEKLYTVEEAAVLITKQAGTDISAQRLFNYCKVGGIRAVKAESEHGNMVYHVPANAIPGFARWYAIHKYGAFDFKVRTRRTQPTVTKRDKTRFDPCAGFAASYAAQERANREEKRR